MIKYDVTGVSMMQIQLVWEDLRPLVLSALKYSNGCYTLEDTRRALLSGKAQLWIATEGTELRGMMITEIQQYPQKKVCFIRLSAGEDLNRWEHLWDVIEDWAISIGCDLVHSWGRPGWKKKAKERGYSMDYVVYVKPLRDEDEDTY